MKKYLYIFLLSFTIVSITSCEDNDGPAIENLNYVSFEQTSYSTGIDVDATVTASVKIYTSKETGADRTFEVSVDPSTTADPGSYVVPSSITVPAGSIMGTLTVSLSDVNLGISVNKLVVKINEKDGLTNGAPITFNYTQNCNEVTATLDFVFDGYGSEVSWSIKDEFGDVVVSKAAGSYSDGQLTASDDIQLCKGRLYTLVIEDVYGDGLSYPADGTYSFSIGGVVKASGGGNYGAIVEHAFDTK